MNISEPKTSQPRDKVFLQPLTAALLECVTQEDVVAAVVDRAVAVLGARAGMVALVVDNGATLQIAGERGYDPGRMARWSKFPVAASLPLSDVVRRNAPLYFEDWESRVAAYPNLATDTEGESEASVSLPLAARRKVFGGMHFSFSGVRHFTEEDGAFLDELARQCSLALDRARLREEVERAQVEAEKARRRQEFLARASALLSDSLEYQSRLESLARLCAPELADWAAVDIFAEDGSLMRLSVSHRFPEREAIMRETQRRFPPETQPNSALLSIIRAGERFLVPHVTHEMLDLSGIEPEHAALLKKVGIHAFLCVPLKVREKVLGAITLGLTGEIETRLTFEPEDVSLAEALAQRAAVAVDNAQLFQSAAAANQRYGRLLETALEGIMLVDTQLRLSYANTQLARMLGYDSPNELIGQPGFILLFPEDIPRARDRWQARRMGEQGEYELRLCRKDGSECWVLAHVTVDTGDDGSFLGTFTMFTDITERRRVQHELAAKNNEIVTIFERVNDAFSAFDHEWRFTYLNHEAEHILGRSRSELIGKCIWDEFEGARETEVYRQYLRAVREQVTTAFEVYYGPLLGWFEVRAYPSPSGLSAYFRNITERRQAEHDRERHHAERERAAGEKAELMAELQEAGLRQRRFLREMLFSLTEGHLQLCDTAADLPLALPKSREPVTLGRSSLRLLRQQVNEVTAALEISTDRANDFLTAVGEASMNAVTHAGGGNAVVHWDPARGVIQVQVRDNGTGIAENALHRATLEKGFSSAGTLGHGFWLILKTCDRCWLLTGPSGTTVVLEQDRIQRQPGWLQAPE